MKSQVFRTGDSLVLLELYEGFTTAKKLVLIGSHNNRMLWVIPGNCGLK